MIVSGYGNGIMSLCVFLSATQPVYSNSLPRPNQASRYLHVTNLISVSSKDECQFTQLPVIQ